MRHFFNKNSAGRSRFKVLLTYGTIILLAVSGIKVSNEKNSFEDHTTENYVYASGKLTGIYEKTDGVLVVDTAKLELGDGKLVQPAKDLVKSGDYITAVNGRKVKSKESLVYYIEEESSDKITLSIRRKNKTFDVEINAVTDDKGQKILGIWVKDDLAGIGTITYVTGDGDFAALGHGIGNNDASQLLSISSGDLYRMKLTGIKKGQAGNPGELCGIVYYGTKSHIGQLSDNHHTGIYGQIDEDELEDYTNNNFLFETGSKRDVKPGKAQIISEISGEAVSYDIEILECQYDGSRENQDMIIEITDEKLLELTGGIVQGMSGSPIIQNGKIVGAVTHVFVNNPRQGYGIFIDNMLEDKG